MRRSTHEGDRSISWSHHCACLSARTPSPFVSRTSRSSPRPVYPLPYFPSSRESQLAVQLLTVLTSDGEQKHRLIAAVLLRRLVLRAGKVWATLPADLHTAIKAHLLHSLTAEPVTNVRHKVCHAIAEVAYVCHLQVAGGTWPELLQSMFALAQSPTQPERLMDLYLFRCLAESACEPCLQPYAAQAKALLAALLADADAAVRLSAAEAVLEVAFFFEDDAVRNTYSDLLPAILAILQTGVMASGSDLALQCIVGEFCCSLRFSDMTWGSRVVLGVRQVKAARSII